MVPTFGARSTGHPGSVPGRFWPDTKSVVRPYVDVAGVIALPPFRTGELSTHVDSASHHAFPCVHPGLTRRACCGCKSRGRGRYSRRVQTEGGRVYESRSPCCLASGAVFSGCRPRHQDDRLPLAPVFARCAVSCWQGIVSYPETYAPLSGSFVGRLTRCGQSIWLTATPCDSRYRIGRRPRRVRRAQRVRARVPLAAPGLDRVSPRRLRCRGVVATPRSQQKGPDFCDCGPANRDHGRRESAGQSVAGSGGSRISGWCDAGHIRWALGL